MSYIDGFVLAVPSSKKASYLDLAEKSMPLFKEFGARRHVEAWGDDVPEGKVTDFRRAVKAKEDEAIVFSWIEYPDREVRDAANEKVMSDPRMEGFGEMPFDMTRMIYGGFTPVLEAGPGGRFGYVDGTIVPVPAGGKSAYRDYGESRVDVFLEHGATRIVDAWADDVPDGEVTDYRRAVNAGEGETMTFCWIEWPSKVVRDDAWTKIMADPRMEGEAPFDLRRMIYGGFAPILDA